MKIEDGLNLFLMICGGLILIGWFFVPSAHSIDNLICGFGLCIMGKP
jgi:hypothetical protein